MMLRSTADPDELAELIDLKVICTVGSYDARRGDERGRRKRKRPSRKYRSRSTRASGRYGFQSTEMDKIAAIYKYMSNLVVVGTFTTYAASWRNRKLTEQQFNTFNEVLDKMTELGLEPGAAHACDSAALFKIRFRQDGRGARRLRRSRAVSPVKNVGGLGRVGYIEAGIEELNWFPKGHRVGRGTRGRHEEADEDRRFVGRVLSRVRRGPAHGRARPDRISKVPQPQALRARGRPEKPALSGMWVC